MKIKKLTALLNIADLAIEHQKARNSTAEAKRAYHLAWQRFETGDDPHVDGADYSYIVHQEDRISAHHPQFDEACAATKAEYAAYKAKKRAEYNVQRRLENAIRKVKL